MARSDGLGRAVGLKDGRGVTLGAAGVPGASVTGWNERMGVGAVVKPETTVAQQPAMTNETTSPTACQRWRAAGLFRFSRPTPTAAAGRHQKIEASIDPADTHRTA